MMQNNDYTFRKDTLRFHDKFNKSLKSYHKIMCLSSTIILGNSFNQKIKLPPNVKHLETGYNFNEQLCSNTDLEKLVFGYAFNRPFYPTPKIKWLEFGHSFNQPLVLTESIKTLKFGNCFNKPLVIKSKLDSLYLGTKFNQKINLDPGATIELMFIVCTNAQRRIISNPGIKCILIDWSCNKPFDLKTIKNASSVSCFINKNVPIKLTKNISELCLCEYEHPTLILNKNIQRLKIDCGYNGPLFLPKKLYYISFCSYSKPNVRLGKHLTHWEQYDGDTNGLELTKNIKHCVLGTDILNNVFIEHPIKKLTISTERRGRKIPRCYDNLSDNITVLILHKNNWERVFSIYNLPRDHLGKNIWV